VLPQGVNQSTVVSRYAGPSTLSGCQDASWRSRYCAIVQAEKIVLETRDEKHVVVGRTLDSEH
jgi:hypothetical protein